MFVDGIIVPKVPSINMACPVDNHSQVKETVFEQQSSKKLPCIIKCSEHNGPCHSLLVIGLWSVTIIFVSAPLQRQKGEGQSILT